MTDPSAVTRALAASLRLLADAVEQGATIGVTYLAVMADGHVTLRQHGSLSEDHIIEHLRQQAYARATPQ